MQPGSGVRAARREYWASVMRAAAVVVVLASAAPGGEAMTFAYGNAYEMLTPGTGNQGVDVTWASVPLLSEASTGYVPLPTGCECLDLAQTAETCTAFTCHETCNLNIGECDEFCCSDPDCTADDLERFNALGECLPDGSSTDSKLCVDTTSLDQVNEKYNMYVEQDDNALEGLVCVSVENNAIEGEFYSSQADLVNNYAVLDSETYQPSYSFAISVDSDAETGSQEYLFGDNLVAAIQTDSFRAAWGGVLSLPTAGVDGTCSPQNFVEFGTDVQVNECLLPVENLEATCTQTHGPLSTALYGEDLYIGTRPSSAINTPSTDWERVTVRSLLYKSLETGSVSSWESGSTLSPTAQPTSEPTALSTASPTESSSGANSTVSASPTVTPSASPTDAPSARRALQVSSVPSTTWDASSGTCENAVVGVKYVIEHNALGVITNVQVDLTLSNVDLSSAAQTAQQGLTQSFHVSFVNTESVADSTAPERVVSGNPGYIVGLPVQAGNLVRQNAGTDDEKTAVSYLPEGLALMAASGPRGACFPSSSSPWYNFVSSTEMTASTPVLFGVDASSACSVTLTYEEFTDLSSWCIDRRNAPLLDLGATRVGIYGNANPWKAWEWVSLHRETSHLSSTAQSPVPGQLVCQNMVDRVDLEVLWTKSGEIDNPQPMILSVRAMVGQSDWQWRKTGASANTTQTFTFSQTVTFIEHKLTEADWFAYKPEIPPIIPAIPADVFYPFDIASAAQATIHGQKSGGHFVTAFLVCLAGLLRA